MELDDSSFKDAGSWVPCVFGIYGQVAVLKKRWPGKISPSLAFGILLLGMHRTETFAAICGSPTFLSAYATFYKALEALYLLQVAFRIVSNLDRQRLLNSLCRTVSHANL